MDRRSIVSSYILETLSFPALICFFALVIRSAPTPRYSSIDFNRLVMDTTYDTSIVSSASWIRR